jgi:hypothetical protein
MSKSILDRVSRVLVLSEEFSRSLPECERVECTISDLSKEDLMAIVDKWRTHCIGPGWYQNRYSTVIRIGKVKLECSTAQYDVEVKYHLK